MDPGRCDAVRLVRLIAVLLGPARRTGQHPGTVSVASQVEPGATGRLETVP